MFVDPHPATALGDAPANDLRRGRETRAAAEKMERIEAKVDVPDLTLDMRRARAAYVTMLSRAVGSLVNAKPDPANGGMTIDQACELVGL